MGREPCSCRKILHTCRVLFAFSAVWIPSNVVPALPCRFLQSIVTCTCESSLTYEMHEAGEQADQQSTCFTSFMPCDQSSRNEIRRGVSKSLSHSHHAERSLVEIIMPNRYGEKRSNAHQGFSSGGRKEALFHKPARSRDNLNACTNSQARSLETVSSKNQLFISKHPELFHDS